ncbi:MAG: cystathionine gamma-lyase [Hyphomonas sp.]|uniref:cystathionine gamma-lyase n=1 Tax=Hyphomonas sp. TaxID=87 RepID=UPI0018173A4A|nr:cystathionine gamma-lyase [Hyphomonas sp.]MBU3919179.1 cystathionine gamma-lyase [Alphaproteobacteria bacterium]MBA3067499.1 cystathionine gamma-lyase [Hyphomonas sp.]MBU4063387.1 cystathionine gamma-lyase [Alphaproteobacteria bacterium]MBU4165207.1 cystathionine gamma-lyase [Alphaproteobacteria bacterium]MBU4568728.1 cystathionine gamma-lyase [Alphaproteobacteria bacterium]
MTDQYSPISRLLHHRTQRLRKGEPVALPIIASSTFQQPGDPDGTHFYGRNGNPTVEEVETEIGLIEAADTVLFPSGMAAIAAVFYAHLKPGDCVLVHADGYYNARALLADQFAPKGIEVRTVATTAFAQADFTGVKLALIETPSNPGLDVCDIAAVAARSKAAGTILVADNTTATPLCQRPLDLGADLSIMADTKAMAGHSDILAGHVSGRNADLIAPIKTWRRLAGALVSPFDAYLLHRGLETLELRVSRANANALAIATALSGDPRVTGLRYPGLASDPAHPVARRQMKGYGPIVSFCLADRATAEAFIARHPLLAAATSFGGVHSSAECRVRWGDAVPEGFIRMACGIEPVSDLVAATLSALDGE